MTRINVLVGDRDNEFESDILDASFYDLDAARSTALAGPKEIPASVFAAAPDLLAACKAALTMSRDPELDETSVEVFQNLLMTAIKKAEGVK